MTFNIKPAARIPFAAGAIHCFASIHALVGACFIDPRANYFVARARSLLPPADLPTDLRRQKILHVCHRPVLLQKSVF